MSKIYKDEPCPHCGNFTNRGVSIDSVIIRNDRILLIKRGTNPYKDFWALPGGYVSWDETSENTVKRETEEETGLSVVNVKLIGVYSLPQRHPRQVINLAYLAEVKSEDAKKGDGAIEVKWFNLDSLPSKLAFDHAQIIVDARRIA